MKGLEQELYEAGTSPAMSAVEYSRENESKLRYIHGLSRGELRSVAVLVDKMIASGYKVEKVKKKVVEKKVKLAKAPVKEVVVKEVVKTATKKKKKRSKKKG